MSFDWDKIWIMLYTVNTVTEHSGVLFESAVLVLDCTWGARGRIKEPSILKFNKILESRKKKEEVGGGVFYWRENYRIFYRTRGVRKSIWPVFDRSPSSSLLFLSSRPSPLCDSLPVLSFSSVSFFPLPISTFPPPLTVSPRFLFSFQKWFRDLLGKKKEKGLNWRKKSNYRVKRTIIFRTQFSVFLPFNLI